jgi:hypothetical protein
VCYALADQGVRLLAEKPRLRQVTRLREDNHQTPVLTSRRDLSVVEVAFRMFEHRRQENFFKYVREEYALDALVDYGVVPDNPARDVPNPRRIDITSKLRQPRTEYERLTAGYDFESFMNAEYTEPTQRHFQTAHKKLKCVSEKLSTAL